VLRQSRPGAQPCILAHHGEGPDGNVGTQDGAGTNAGCRIDSGRDDFVGKEGVEDANQGAVWVAYHDPGSRATHLHGQLLGNQHRSRARGA
jgi:hypothetical protein